MWGEEVHIEKGTFDGLYDTLVKNCQWQDAYYGLVADIVRNNNYKTYVEVGCGYGQHLKNVKETGVHAWGVDCYVPYEDDSFSEMICNLPIQGTPQDKFDALADKAREVSGAILIREPSLQAVNRFQNNSLDCVFIDGNHSYEAVKQDLAAWWDKVRVGGTLVGDDYFMVDVNNAVREFARTRELNLQFTTKNGNYVLFFFVKE